MSTQTRSATSTAALPPGYWPVEKSQPIIDKTQTIRLEPDLSQLSKGERQAIDKLLEVGRIFQRLYEEQRDPEALSSFSALQQLDRKNSSPAATRNLLLLYRLNQGPIATTLDNKREPFLPVEAPQPGKNMYPRGVTRENIESYLAAAQNSEARAEILDGRTVVRLASSANIDRDLAVLEKYPALDTLHPKLRRYLQQSRNSLRQSPTPDRAGYYAVPYSVAYAEELTKAYGLLNDAAAAVQTDDEEFARYLRNRARDLLSNDYESGDAA